MVCTRVPMVPLLPLKKLRVRVTLSYPTHKVFVKVSKRSVVGMASKHSLQRWQHHQKPPGLPQGQSDAIYWYQFGDLACDDEYILETSRTVGERYKEHLKDPSPIHHHNNQTNHPINHNNFKIIGREGHHLSRYIKESIFVRVNSPTLNNNVGKFNLPHIWDKVLINTPGLKLNK